MSKEEIETNGYERCLPECNFIAQPSEVEEHRKVCNTYLQFLHNVRTEEARRQFNYNSFHKIALKQCPVENQNELDELIRNNTSKPDLMLRIRQWRASVAQDAADDRNP